MKKIAIEMSTDLRQAFKIACSLNNITMKNALIEEVNKILDNNELTYNTSRPDRGDGMCVLCLNVENSFTDKVKARKELSGDKIRDVYITAIINYLDNSPVHYDYSDDIKGE